MEQDELKSLFKKLSPDQDTTPHEVVKDPPIRSQKILEKIKKSSPFAIAILFLIFAFQERVKSSPLPPKDKRPIFALMPMVPIPKGDPIPLSVLRVVSVDSKQFSKTQLLGLVLENDLEGVAHKIRSKKTLPPNKVLFWKDLELEKTNKGSDQPVITYAKETL